MNILRNIWQWWEINGGQVFLMGLAAFGIGVEVFDDSPTVERTAAVRVVQAIIFTLFLFGLARGLKKRGQP